MGFNTSVIVLNDALHYIEEDPTFGKKLAEAIQRLNSNKGGIDISAGGHANAATAIETHHADVSSLIAIGGNQGTLLCYGGGYRHDEGDKVRMLQSLADSLGYTLMKKK